MSTFRSTCLLLCAALGLPAATLTIGTAAIAPGQTGTVTVALATAAGDHVSGLQFDLTYDPTVFTVLNVAAGSAATSASKGVQSALLSSSGTTAVRRAIIIGGQTAETLPQGTAEMASGTVATLTVTVKNDVALLGTSQALTISGLVATTPSATAAALTGANGTVTIANTYLVGDASPVTGDSVGAFGDGQMNIFDLVQTLFAVNSIPGYRPPACTDRFDAMDSFPADTATTRGGDGALNIFDLVLELFRVNNLDTSRPVRNSAVAPGCPGASALTAMARTNRSAGPSRVASVAGRLMTGAAEKLGASEERIPVYLEAGRDLTGVAVSFGAGDGNSLFRFEPANVVPSLTNNSQRGSLAVAWLDGLNVRAGSRMLLGYITAPTGTSARLTFYSVSAGELNGSREIQLEMPNAGLR